MKYTLYMGPVSPPFTGQSIAFTTIIDNINKNDNNNIIIDIESKGKNKLLFNIFLCIKISYYLIFRHIETIYFTCSRSFSGSVRDIVLLYWAKKKKIKIINHIHGTDFKSFYHNLPSWYKKIFFRYYSNIETSIVLTESMKTELSDFQQMKLEVVPNAYSSSLDSCPLEKIKNENTPIRLLYLSNIMKSKGILNLLEACGELFDKYKNIELHIAGAPIGDHLASKNKIKSEFEQLLKVLSEKYPGQISYRGVCKGEEKKKLLWESDIFILPTFHPTEALPISILEAMRTGNYIISTNHNYIPEILSEKNGCLVQPDSVEAITNAIGNILSSSYLTLYEVQNYNIQHAIKTYGEKKYIDSVSSLILG